MDKTKHASVKACPFCGNRERGRFNAVTDENFRVQIKCQKCHALGPAVSFYRCESMDATRIAACMQWDKRASEQVAASVALPEGFVIAPNYRGYAHLGTGRYLLLHSHKDDEAELCIVPATDQEKAGREVGDLRDNGPDEVSADRMAVRIRFENAAGLDALEQQLRLLREVHFAAAPVAPEREG